MVDFFKSIPNILETLYGYCDIIYDYVFVKSISQILNPIRDLGFVGRVITDVIEAVTPLSNLTPFQFVVGAGFVFFVGFAIVKFVLDIIL